MQLTILGCRGGVPADGQPSSGYLVETAGARLLIDCGPGIAVALSAVAPPSSLDAVVISHFHSDHCYDLLPIGKSLLNGLVEVQGGPPRREGEFRPVPLYVPSGARELFAKWGSLFPVTTLPLLDQAFEVAFDVQEYTPGASFQAGDCTIEPRALRHVLPNCGMRVEAPCGSLAYTGDTGITPDLVELASGADLLLAEATLSETDRSDHGRLSGTDAGRIASAAGVSELVLTHFASSEPEWLSHLSKTAAKEFAGPVHLGSPGMKVEVGRGR
ncbi:MBL fold metallo-hydrolase [Streptomyces spongiae]|uniref:MBL fold metallo-hydrolase n=1 Tax=Streptomyces spongiae TaxID=565072 RepID=A0A5N8XG04_9ACTN|nr:MBL fold metallo-hydrolase [Streptomyces spongiae]MPY57986.1 MBL fold metallo-hydrolase [Streptomyces spongiae]